MISVLWLLYLFLIGVVIAYLTYALFFDSKVRKFGQFFSYLLWPKKLMANNNIVVRELKCTSK